MSLFLDSWRVIKRVRDKAYSLLASGGFYHFGERSVICLPIRLAGEDAIEIGSEVYLGSNCWMEVMDDTQRARGPVISIGDRTSVSGCCTITAVMRVRIGRGVLIARFVHISDHVHEYGAADVAIKDQGIKGVAPVTIGDGAWIGHGAVICPGVCIGKNAVVGANSVVRENIPDHAVAAGIPARLIRQSEFTCHA